jgi:succinate-acetate transporter protein
VATGLLLFLLPDVAIKVWPWTLTPLTARVMGAIFVLGLAAVGAFTERRWSAFRLMLQVAALMLALILAGGVRAAGDLDGSNILTWLFAAGFVGLLVAAAALYVRMERRVDAPTDTAASP